MDAAGTELMRLLPWAAALAAGVAGACLACAFLRWRAAQRRLRELRRAAGPQGAVEARFECGGLAAWVLGQVVREGRAARPARMRSLLARLPLGVGLSGADALLVRAGMPDAADDGALRAVRLRIMAALAPAGVVSGLVFSPELAMLMGFAGAVFGYACLPWALKAEARERNADMERHLSEMIEVVVLGLRSGLSFERSFMLYPRYFDTGLAGAMERAAGSWEMGLQTREQALRRLEAEYDSPLLSRVVGNMVRSLRFGNSIADSMESSAIEAREVHKSRMEEKVAKVAVKMMLPVGALILPAMLLLVLGPVLLELVEGF